MNRPKALLLLATLTALVAAWREDDDLRRAPHRRRWSDIFDIFD